MTKAFRWGLLVLVAVLWGCAGRDFVRPDAASVTVGRTTYKEVLDRFGQPFREGTALKNEKSIRTLSYAYADVGGKPYRDGVTPARAQGFHFHNDVLVGHEFVSSWASDHSDFDDRRIGDIVKATTTRDQIIAMFGRPGGIYTYPMIKAASGNALVYAYFDTRRTGFASFSFYRKMLVVTFDAAGIAVDVEFTTEST